MVKNMFGIFKRKEPPFDESSDCFLAMQYWLKKCEEDEGQLYIQRMMAEEEKKKEQEEYLDEIEQRNSIRYSLNYMYKNKYH